jgi:hypothetical protein
MDSEERIQAVIALEMPDRVPLAPFLDHWAATYTGLTKAELMSEPEKRIQAVMKTARDFAWDMTYVGNTIDPSLLRVGVPQRLKLPGIDLPADSVHQFEEREFMRPEDYALLAGEGLVPFLPAIVGRIYPEMTTPDTVLASLAVSLESLGRHSQRVREAGMVPAVGFVLLPSFEYFSFARGITQGFSDLRRRPNDLKRAGQRFAQDFLQIALRAVSENGVKRVFIGASRSSPVFISPAHFEEFVLPELLFLANGLIDAGVQIVFHCDTSWTKFLHYFRRFPRGKCVMMLDGSTDIFLAKEVLGDTMALQGDVPALLLAEGAKDEVRTYCRRLIEKAGSGGGFILGSGCSIPANAKTENVMALTEAAQTWGRYG